MDDVEWVYGVDGGGTSCRLRVESMDGGLLYARDASRCNPSSVGWGEAETQLSGLFALLYSETDISPKKCAAGFAGIAGIGRPGDEERIASIVKRASLAAPVPGVSNDAVPALVGALGRREGILLIAGTGSIAIGMTGSGRLERSGGWGHILGDEGSAYDVSRKALAACARFQDGRGPGTAILQAALDYFGCGTAFDVIPAVYTDFDKSKVAGFAAEVAKKAKEGDKVARRLLSEAARDLVALVVSVAARVDEGLTDKRIAFAGGFIENDVALRRSVAARLAARLPGYAILPAIADAATGACALARERAGLPLQPKAGPGAK